MKRWMLSSKLRIGFLGLSIFSLVLFFAQLYVTNTVNREGVEQLSAYEREIAQYRKEIERIEQDIATYSAMERVEKRAKELGFDKRESTEYIR